MKQVGICTGGSQACDQAVLEHIRAAASVLANDDAGRLVVAVTLTQSVIVAAVFSPDDAIIATVASAFIPGSTHSRYGSSLAYAGLPHTNEHLCDHVFITILLTPDLLSSRPG